MKKDIKDDNKKTYEGTSQKVFKNILHIDLKIIQLK